MRVLRAQSLTKSRFSGIKTLATAQKALCEDEAKENTTQESLKFWFSVSRTILPGAVQEHISGSLKLYVMRSRAVTGILRDVGGVGKGG